MIFDERIIGFLILIVMGSLFLYVFVNLIISISYIGDVQESLQEKYRSRYGKEFYAYGLLSEAEVKLHFEKDSPEYNLAMKQAMATKRVVKGFGVFIFMFALTWVIVTVRS